MIADGLPLQQSSREREPLRSLPTVVSISTSTFRLLLRIPLGLRISSYLETAPMIFFHVYFEPDSDTSWLGSLTSLLRSSAMLCTPVLAAASTVA